MESTTLGNHRPIWAEPTTSTPSLIDPNVIVDVIKNHFKIQLKLIGKPIYKKLYLKWIDKVAPLLRGDEVPNFSHSQVKMKNPLQNTLFVIGLNVGKSFRMNIVTIVFTFSY